MTQSEMLLHATVLVKCQNAKGEDSTGTGFFFSLFNHGGQQVLVIVTNKHVVDGAVKGSFKFTLAKPDGSPDIGKSIDVNIDDFASQWIAHPSSDVDLTILPIGKIVGQLATQGTKPFFVTLDQSLIPTDEVLSGLTPLEDLLTVGYPDGISDSLNNIPIFRKGITATPVYINFDGKPQFLIDAAIFPGSSGSPTFIFNQGSYPSRDGNLVIGNRVIFVGIVFAVALHTSTGEIKIFPAPTQARPFAETRIPNNLGLCVNSQRLLDFEPILVSNGFLIPPGYVMRVQKPYS